MFGSAHTYQTFSQGFHKFWVCSIFRRIPISLAYKQKIHSYKLEHIQKHTKHCAIQQKYYVQIA